jgi:peptidoglycan/LPS O-acetylase OafA/YrhL
MRKIPPYLLLDAARGIAALGVVIFHSNMSFLETNPDYARSPYYVFGQFGYLGVVLFFIISGYCITGTAYHALLSKEGVGRYALNRWRRIYPPYLAACALAVLVEIAVTLGRQHNYVPPDSYYAPPHPESILFWLATVTLLQVELHQFCLVMVFWTLCYEIAFYFLVGLFLVISQLLARYSPSKTSAPILLFGLNCLATYFSLTWMIISPSTCPFPFTLWYQFGLGAMFFAVVASRSAPETDIHRSILVARWQLAIAVAFMCLFILFQNVAGWEGHFSSKVDGSACLIFLGLLALLFPYERNLAQQSWLRPLMRLGAFSYSLYLTHAIGLPFIMAAMQNLGFDQNWFWVNSLVQIAFSVLIGWIFYLLVEWHFISKRQQKRIAVV